MGDFVYRIGSNINVIGRPPSFYDSSRPAPDGIRFCSLYAVRQEDAAAIEDTAGTAAGFRGVVWSRFLWADFDTEEAGKAACTSLERSGLGHTVYHTGGRGLHIGVLRAADPSHTLPMQDKLWAVENLPGCDPSIYWHLHLLRLPGALHERTGLPKRLLYTRPGRELHLPPYSPAAAVSTAKGPGKEEGQRKSIFDCWGVMSRLNQDPSLSRQKHLVYLAMSLRGEAGVTAEEALWVSLEVNRGFDEPKEESEVQRIVDWAYEQAL
jgi:hypothetical protein